MKDISWTACLRLGVTAAAVYLICAGRSTLTALLGVLSPLLIGGGAACIVNIPMTALERRLFPRGGRLGRSVCLTVSLAGAVAAAAWLAGVILPELIRCAGLLAGEMPQVLSTLGQWLEGSGAAAWLRAAGLPDWQTLLQQGLPAVLKRADEVLGHAAEALTSLTSGAANAMLALMLAGYMLAGKERLGAQAAGIVRRVLGETTLTRVTAVLRTLHEAFCVYVKGQCVEALLLGGLCLLGMLLLRLPQALTVSVVAGLSALIPLVGAPCAAAIGALLLLEEGVSAALTFAAFFLILQQVESNFIYPRMVSATLGLSPMWMLAAMLVGGGMFGLAGTMLAVPVASAARTLLTRS